MTVAEYLVPEWLNGLRRSDPDIAVSLQMGNSEYVLAQMRASHADLGFVEGAAEPEGLNFRIVVDDDLVVVVAASHPWARRRRPLGLEAFAETPLVLREPGSGTREVLETELRRHSLSVEPLIELGSTTAIKAAIVSGLGPGVLSRLAVAVDLAERRLIEVDVTDLGLARSIRAVWPLERAPSLPARRLLRQIQGAATH